MLGRKKEERSEAGKERDGVGGRRRKEKREREKRKKDEKEGGKEWKVRKEE